MNSAGCLHRGLTSSGLVSWVCDSTRCAAFPRGRATIPARRRRNAGALSSVSACCRHSGHGGFLSLGLWLLQGRDPVGVMFLPWCLVSGLEASWHPSTNDRRVGLSRTRRRRKQGPEGGSGCQGEHLFSSPLLPLLPPPPSPPLSLLPSSPPFLLHVKQMEEAIRLVLLSQQKPNVTPARPLPSGSGTYPTFWPLHTKLR